MISHSHQGTLNKLWEGPGFNSPLVHLFLRFNLFFISTILQNVVTTWHQNLMQLLAECRTENPLTLDLKYPAPAAWATYLNRFHHKQNKSKYLFCINWMQARLIPERQLARQVGMYVHTSPVALPRRNVHTYVLTFCPLYNKRHIPSRSFTDIAHHVMARGSWTWSWSVIHLPIGWEAVASELSTYQKLVLMIRRDISQGKDSSTRNHVGALGV